MRMPYCSFFADTPETRYGATTIVARCAYDETPALATMPIYQLPRALFNPMRVKSCRMCEASCEPGYKPTRSKICKSTRAPSLPHEDDHEGQNEVLEVRERIV